MRAAPEGSAHHTQRWHDRRDRCAGARPCPCGGDGDFMFAPSTLWTAAHHRIPMLFIVQHHRAYHQEYMYLTAIAARRSRGIANAHIRTTLTDPNIDFATVARGFGVHGEGPVTNPNDLAPALKRA